jgi:hypothetical protein
MAEAEHTALLVERGVLHGVRVTLQRGREVVVAAASWPVTETAAAPPAATDGTPAPAAAADGLAETLRAARKALKIESGCSLALPAADLMLKVLRLPPADSASLASIVRLQMEKIAPFAGEDLSVGHEVLARDDDGLTVIAAAAPRPLLDALARRLATAGLRLARLDVALLGWWRQLSELRLPELAEGRCAVLFEQGGEWDMMLAEAGRPLLARALGRPLEPQDLTREVTLSLLSAEMDASPAPLAALLVVAEQPPGDEWLAALREAAGIEPRFLPRERLGKPALGVARRDGEKDRLDLVPPAWRAQERALRARRRLLTGLGAAAGVWVLLAAALGLAPWIVRRATAGVEARIAALEPAYRAVSETRQRVRLIRSYMDRSRSLLEMLRVICEAMPPDVVFSALTYRREEGVKLVGDAAQPALVYAFKDALDASGCFASIRLSGTTRAPSGRHRFEIDARFEGSAE